MKLTLIFAMLKNMQSTEWDINTINNLPTGLAQKNSDKWMTMAGNY